MHYAIILLTVDNYTDTIVNLQHFQDGNDVSNQSQNVSWIFEHAALSDDLKNIESRSQTAIDRRAHVSAELQDNDSVRYNNNFYHKV